MDLAQLRTELRDLLTDPNDTRWSLTKKDRFLNEACLTAAKRTYILRSTANLLVGPDEPSVNILAQPNAFDDAYWTKSNASVSAGSAQAPDGTMAADKLIENTATSTHYMTRDALLTVGQPATASVFAKPAGRNEFTLSFNSTGVGSARFNVSTGLVTATNGVTATIYPATNGFYRCIINVAAVAAAGNFRMQLYNAGNSYLGDGASGVHFWRAEAKADATPTAAFYLMPGDFLTFPPGGEWRGDALWDDALRLAGLPLGRLATTYFTDRITNWESDTGTPWGYLYGPYGDRLVRNYPYRLTVESPLPRLFYCRRPNTLVATTDVSDLPEAYHYGIVWEAAHLCYIKDFQNANTAKADRCRAMADMEWAKMAGDFPVQPKVTRGRYVV